MTDLGLLCYYLGIEVNQSKESITLSQSKYIKIFLTRFQMEDCNNCATPIEINCDLVPGDGEITVDATLYRQLTENLIYLTTTKPKHLILCGSSFKIHARTQDTTLEGGQEDTRIFESVRNN